MPQEFRECGNCGWSDRAEHFTFSWCDECAKAAVKGFVGAIAAGTAALILRLMFGG